jgi:hypothetical protein
LIRVKPSPVFQPGSTKCRISAKLRCSSARKSGVRDADEGVGALAQGLAVQVDRAVLGHDPVDVSAARHDTGAELQGGRDARDRALRRRGGQRQNGLAPLRERRAMDEVHLSADARVDPVADGVRADLTGEVDLERRVDRRDLVVLANERRVVRAVAGVELDHQVVVDEVVEPPTAVDEARDDATRVDLLVPVGDHPVLDQGDQPVREHLGVHPEVELVAEAGEHGVGDGADAHLQRRAVLDEGGDVLADERFLGDGSVAGWPGSGRSVATKAVMRENGICACPWVRGICSLISAMTTSAASVAARVASTEVPSVQTPL